MRKFTKGLITGIGAGMTVGIGASIAILIMTERESIRVENDLKHTMSDLIDYLNTEEGQKNKHLFSNLAEELTGLGEIRISKVFKNLAKAMNLNEESKKELNGFLK